MNILSFENNKVIFHTQHKAFSNLRSDRDIDTYKEMYYVYYICDYNSHPNRQGLAEKESHEYAVLNAGLPNDYIPSKPVLDAMEAYHELRDTAPIKYLQSLYVSINKGIRTIDLLNATNETLLKKIELLDDNKEEDLKSKVSLIKMVVDNQQTLFDMASKSEDYVSKLKRLYEEIKKEDQKKEVGLGGLEVTSSMID